MFCLRQKDSNLFSACQNNPMRIRNFPFSYGKSPVTLDDHKHDTKLDPHLIY
jgi:hypothetical protein